MGRAVIVATTWGRYDAKAVSFRDDFFSSLDLAFLLPLDDVVWTDWFSFAWLLRDLIN